MLKRIFFLSVLLICVAGLVNISDAQNFRNVKATMRKVNDNAAPRPYIGKILNYSDPGPVSFSINADSFYIAETDTNARTTYDLQSNSCIRFIQQDPSNTMNLHATFMVSKTTDWSDRNTPYLFSSDGGVTWIFLGNPNPSRAGYPCLGLTTNGRAVIMNHSEPGSNPDTRLIMHVDLAPGVGSFDLLDPGNTNNAADQPVWASFMTTQSDKVPFMGSEFAGDTCFYNVCTNISPPGTFQGYMPLINGSTAEEYSVATGSGNKVGLAYIAGAFSPDPEGTVYLKESTDDGATFGTEHAIYTPNYLTGDSMGAIRSIDMIYYNGQPCVVMGTNKLFNVIGQYTPDGPGAIKFWSPNINGGVAVTIDSLGGLNGFGNISLNESYVCVSRAVLGKSADNNALYVAYSRAREDTNAAGINYFDVYFSYSTDGGATWATPIQITNNSGPLRDCRFPSISQSNNYDIGGPYHYVYIVYQSDSVAGSFVNGAPASYARMMFCKVMLDEPIGIRNLGSEVPGSYQLYQNYPNPFNPSTKIKFALPKNEFVSLKVYDILGREVAVLINQELQAGNKEYEFNAVNLPSGIYFYKIKAGDFTDAKKMVLVK